MNPFHLIAVEEAVSCANSIGSEVSGVIRPSEGLVQILGRRKLESRSLRPLGRVFPHPVENAVEVKTTKQTVYFSPEAWVPPIGSVEVVSLAELDSRRADILGASALASSFVSIIGCGSLGSMIALELAKAGAGHLTLVDPTRLDVSNISRHACDLTDIGRFKAEALADLVRFRGSRASTITEYLTLDGDAPCPAELEAADLVIVATDSQPTQFRFNEFCLEKHRIGLFPQAYERAAAGEVFVLKPGCGPCLYCATGFRVNLPPALQPRERRQAYQSADANQLVAEPGLGLDVAHLATVSTAYALALLDPHGSRGSLLPEGFNLFLVHGGSEPRGGQAELFHHPFEVIPARVSRPEPCPVCGWNSTPAEAQPI